METPLAAADRLKSLNVEESRAKRLERQHARLRDRGGIFRPENRNTNLFDILCQATHRRSPAKGRGRSRSRSVSPKKKTTTVQTARKPRSSKANARTSPRKSTAATPDVAVTEELPEEDMDPKPRAKKPKGKQKQVAGIVDVGDDEPKPKPRAKRAGSKKATTKAPRRTAKKATNDDPPDEDVDLATKAQKTRPKAKRKKQDAEDDEFLEDPPPRPKKTRTTKSKATARLLTPEPAEAKASKKLAPKSECRIEESEDKNSKPKGERSSGRSTVPLDPPPQPTRSRTTKRKADNSDIGDESRPQKRKALSKPHHDSEMDVTSRNKHKPVNSPGNNTTNESLVDAINRASDPKGRPMGVGGSQEVTEAKRVSEKSKHTKPMTPSRHADIVENSEPNIVPKARKQARTQTEIEDKPSTPAKVVLETAPVPVVLVDKIGPPKARRAKKSKEVDDKEPEKPRALKTVSRKRKENEAAVKPAGGVPAERKKPLKGGPKIPAHIKRKLKERKDDYVSDDEPDPIDFLS